VKRFFLLLWVLACASARAQGLTITFIDVGQGDAALIRAGHRVVLIDAGPSPTRVADWLRRAGVDTIDLAIASHNHADHIGGMPRVLETIPVRNYMENGMAATTRTYARIVTLLEERGIPVLRATPRRIDLGDGVTLRVLSSAPNPKSQNDASIGVELTSGSFHALFTGDAEGRQRAFWSRDSLARIQLLKVSHHGSINGTDVAWLSPLHPCAAVISVGAKNSFSHPSRQVIRLLDSAGVRAWRTDRVGTVTVAADSSGTFHVTALKRSTAFTPTCEITK
jgi:beta-lactamase superfamily II metal-dependent hydrolase